MASTINFDTIERDFSLLNVLFEKIIDHMKDSSPLWEDLLIKTSKFHASLKNTLNASSGFLESFQKVADLATNTKGITKDIGVSLTRLCMRQKAIESKLRLFNNSLVDCLVEPLTDKLEEWKKKVNILEREHCKEYKKFRIDFKKKSSETMHLHKKLCKKSQAYAQNPKKLQVDELQYKYENSLHDVRDFCLLFEETEKQSLRFAMMEERDHFCTFFTFIRPIVDIEMTVLNEVVHLEEILADLNKNTNEASQAPHLTSIKIEQIIKDFKVCPEFLQTIIENDLVSHQHLNDCKIDSQSSRSDSPESRKSSMCSMNSLTSCSSDASSNHHRELIYRQQHASLKQQQQQQQDSTVYARHTLAGIPGLMTTKCRPALSIHTFDHQQHDEELILRRQSTTTNIVDLQPIVDSLTSTSNEENSNLSLQSDDSGSTSGGSNNLRFMNQKSNRSRTLPADKIAEGMKELLKLQSPTKSTHSNDDTSLSSQSIKSPSSSSLNKNSLNNKPPPPIRRNSSITTKTSPNNKPTIFSTTNDYEDIQLNQRKQRLDKIDEMAQSLCITAATLNVERARLKQTHKEILVDYENLPPPPESFYMEEINGR